MEKNSENSVILEKTRELCQAIIEQLGAKGDLLAMIRESLVSLNRLLAYHTTTAQAANGPSKVRPTLPGSTCPAAKTMALTSQSVRTSRPRFTVRPMVRNGSNRTARCKAACRRTPSRWHRHRTDETARVKRAESKNELIRVKNPRPQRWLRVARAFGRRGALYLSLFPAVNSSKAAFAST